MGNKLFIGGMNWDTTADDLRETFKEFGEIMDATVITDRDSGRSRGFGFVTFYNQDNVAAAISKMDGSVLAGRTLVVNEARERQSGGGGDRRRGGGFNSGSRRY